MSEPLKISLDQSGRDGPITLEVTASSVYDMKAARLMLEGAVYALEDAEKAATKAAAHDASKYFPGEKFCEPKGKDYGILDAVKLVSRSQTADSIRLLQRWGQWWKVRVATSHGKAWLLTSIADQPRELPKKQVHEIFMYKDLDPDFAVIAALRFPTPFTFKLAEQGARIDAS